MPPFEGPRAMECCTRNPVKTSSFPLSMATGMCTINSRVGYRSTFHIPSSRLSLCAARSNRAVCASVGLSSCSSETDFVAVVMTISDDDELKAAIHEWRQTPRSISSQAHRGKPTSVPMENGHPRPSKLDRSRVTSSPLHSTFPSPISLKSHPQPSSSRHPSTRSLMHRIPEHTLAQESPAEKAPTAPYPFAPHELCARAASCGQPKRSQ